MIEVLLLGLLVGLAATSIDYSHSRLDAALADCRAGLPARHRAARWSVAQWTAATVAFVVAVRVDLWYLPLEGAGLYLGTYLGSAPRRGSVE